MFFLIKFKIFKFVPTFITEYSFALLCYIIQ